MNQDDDERLAEWVADWSGQLVPTSDVRGFKTTLESYPWAVTRLDWKLIDGTTVDLSEEQLDLGDARIKGYEHVLAYFVARDRSLIGPRDAVLANLDEIFLGTPGRQYVCGVSYDLRGQPEFHFDAFGEYDGWATLRLRV